MSLKIVLVIVAFVLFLLSAIGIGTPKFDRFNIMALGLAFWALSQVLSGQ